MLIDYSLFDLLCFKQINLVIYVFKVSQNNYFETMTIFYSRMQL